MCIFSFAKVKDIFDQILRKNNSCQIIVIKYIIIYTISMQKSQLLRTHIQLLDHPIEYYRRLT
jgi:hypothetical protein